MARWSEYHSEPNYSQFWSRRLREPAVRTLVVFGLGFDPRCLIAVERILALGHGDRIGVLGLRLSSRPLLGEAGRRSESLAQANATRLDALTGGTREGVLEVATDDAEGHGVAGIQAVRALESIRERLSTYSDVIVDISGMPRSLYFPLVSFLIRLADRGTFKNLHVAVVEDPDLDAAIRGTEYGAAEFLHTFRPPVPDARYVWLPLLGAHEQTRLDKIYGRIKSACIEICPVVPFPARDLRRPDNVLFEHGTLLFEGFRASVGNVILCDESNPFDVYRKLVDVEEYYRSRLGGLAALPNLTAVLSPLSSKTLSLGMLLAAAELKLPVCHVEAGGYNVEEAAVSQRHDLEPIDIWLTGEPYSA